MPPYNRTGHASVSETRPKAFAVCDRCGFVYNHQDLNWQPQWTGPRLQNLRILVCDSCLDKPQEQLRTLVFPPDPVPIDTPRPEPYISEISTLPSGIVPGPYGDFPAPTNTAGLTAVSAPSLPDSTDPVPAQAQATPPSSYFSVPPV